MSERRKFNRRDREERMGFGSTILQWTPMRGLGRNHQLMAILIQTLAMMSGSQSGLDCSQVRRNGQKRSGRRWSRSGERRKQHSGLFTMYKAKRNERAKEIYHQRKEAFKKPIEMPDLEMSEYEKIRERIIKER